MSDVIFFLNITRRNSLLRKVFFIFPALLFAANAHSDCPDPSTIGTQTFKRGDGGSSNINRFYNADLGAHYFSSNMSWNKLNETGVPNDIKEVEWVSDARLSITGEMGEYDVREVGGYDRYSEEKEKITSTSVHVFNLHKDGDQVVGSAVICKYKTCRECLQTGDGRAFVMYPPYKYSRMLVKIIGKDWKNGSCEFQDYVKPNEACKFEFIEK